MRRCTPAAVVVLVSALAALVGCAADGPAGVATPDPAVVDTESGPVRGIVAGAVSMFRGIPYAAPPVGDLRWAPPVDPPRWTEPRDATSSGPVCAQNGLELGRPSDDEDCLTLDVTTPAADSNRRPVIVWVHGGSYKDGGGSLYGSSRLAAGGDAVVVTINYRLGAFGYLVHPALPGAENLGLADQQAALRWVRRNAAAFGGAPDDVTLAGESGGGAAVCAHLTSPASDDLFDKAIVQSADCTATWSPDRDSAPRSIEVARQRGRELADRLGCSDPSTAAACLRGRPVADVRAASDDGTGVGPAFGTPLLPEDPAQVIAAGRARAVPTLIGFNRDEERFRIYGDELASGPTTLAGFRREVERIAGPGAGAVLTEYPCADDACAAPTLGDLLTARNYARGTVDTAGRLSGRAPVFAYEFADPAAPWFRDLPPARFPQGAFHTAELPFLFDVGWTVPLTPPQQDLADRMIGYWTRFARTGDPNGDGAEPWDRFDGPSSVQTLAPGPGGIRPAVDLEDRHRLRFWSGTTG